jgi:hypothetical protein
VLTAVDAPRMLSQDAIRQQPRKHGGVGPWRLFGRSSFETSTMMCRR